MGGALFPVVGFKFFISRFCHMRFVVESLDKMLHDDYLCLMVSLQSTNLSINKQIQPRNLETNGNTLNLKSGFVLRVAPSSLSRR